jgi:hypothetical protein
MLGGRCFSFCWFRPSGRSERPGVGLIGTHVRVPGGTRQACLVAAWGFEGGEQASGHSNVFLTLNFATVGAKNCGNPAHRAEVWRSHTSACPCPPTWRSATWRCIRLSVDLQAANLGRESEDSGRTFCGAAWSSVGCWER